MEKEPIWKNILIAIDYLEPSMRAVEYVGEMVGDRKGFSLYLFHILPPFPPELLEFGGAEDPKKEEALTQQLREDQARWVADAREAVQPLFLQAKETLQWSHVTMEMVCNEVSPSVHRPDVVRDILESAQKLHCGTIVVGRDTFPSYKEMFKKHIGEELVQKGQGFAIWVVE
jgi:hypothetical protein